MPKSVRQRHKETSAVVFSGLLINYPLSIMVLYLLLDVMGMDDPFWIATYSTAIMTVFAYIRVYIVRRFYDKKS